MKLSSPTGYCSLQKPCRHGKNLHFTRLLTKDLSAMLGHRPTHVEIDLAALRHNLQQARRQAGPNRQVLAVVKADAYGHGAARVAPVLQAAGADCFGVAMVEEGAELRRAGIVRPILVLGGIYPDRRKRSAAML
jgi:alanine racemase